MKIREICENTADDLENALIHYAEKKHREREHLTKGSAFTKGFWKGRRAVDKMKDNPLVHGAQRVAQWAKKQSK